MRYRSKRGGVESEAEKVAFPRDYRGPFIVHKSYVRCWLFAAFAAGMLAIAYSEFLARSEGAIFDGVIGLTFLGYFLHELRRIGVPALVVDERGITTEQFLFVPWDEIDRIYLRETGRGKTTHWLVLSIESPEKYFRRTGFFARLFRRLSSPSERRLLRISLDFLRQKPNQIMACVNHLRAVYAESAGIQLKTGDLSIDKRLAEVDRLMNEISPENHPSRAKLRAVNAKIRKLLEESQNEFALDRELFRKEVVFMWPLMAFVLLLLLLLVW